MTAIVYINILASDYYFFVVFSFLSVPENGSLKNFPFIFQFLFVFKERKKKQYSSKLSFVYIIHSCVFMYICVYVYVCACGACRSQSKQFNLLCCMFIVNS